MKEFAAIIVIGIILFVCFVIYFVFKQIQFVIQAINLYKDMVTRQDVMIKLLKDIRQGAAVAPKKGSQAVSNYQSTFFCTNCGEQLEPGETECSSCNANVEPTLECITDESLDNKEQEIVKTFVKYRKERKELSVDGLIMKMEEEGPYSEKLIREVLQKAKGLTLQRRQTS